MKMQIRRGVFETNSSSSHSLSMNPEAVRDMALAEGALRSGKMKVEIDDHFGWEWRRLYTPESKIAYLLSQAAESELENFSSTEQLRESSDRAAFILDTIERETGIEIEIDVTTDYPGVDHQSRGVTDDLHFDSKALMDFVFSSQCYVQTGNDNDEPPAMINTDLGQKEDTWPDHFAQKKPRGLKVTLTAQKYCKEAEFFVNRDAETLKGEAPFCVARGLRGFVKGLVISEVAVTLFKPRRFNSWSFEDGVMSNGSEKWLSRDRLEEMARDGIHRLLNEMSEEGGDIRVLRDLKIDMKVEAAPEDRYGPISPRICATGYMTESNIDRVKEGFVSLAEDKAAYEERMRAYEARRAEKTEDPGF